MRKIDVEQRIVGARFEPRRKGEIHHAASAVVNAVVVGLAMTAGAHDKRRVTHREFACEQTAAPDDERVRDAHAALRIP
jgi:hypothetical protein